MRTLLIFVVASFAIFVESIIADDENDALRAVAQGSIEFSDNFFKVVANGIHGNLITSPLSAQVVLAMAAYGADGTTASQMRSALHIPAGDNEFSLSGYKSLIRTMNTVRGVELRLANKIYTANRFTVKPAYKQLTGEKFFSASQELDFNDAGTAASTINSWCEAQTNNRIKNVITPGSLDANTKLILVNAVYFKGKWAKKFNPRLTRSRNFHIDARTTKRVPTMFIKSSFRFGNFDSLGARFIEIPYQKGEVSMIIILPYQVNGLKRVQENLHRVNFTDSLNRAFVNDVELYLPKFRIESTLQLQDTLEKMGMTDMFQNSADFSGIADVPLQVSKVVQKAFIEVNEEGSEAAAVTVLVFAVAAFAIFAGTKADGDQNDRNAFWAVTESATEFSNNFLRAMANATPGNLISSPFSAQIVLAIWLPIELAIKPHGSYHVHHQQFPLGESSRSGREVHRTTVSGHGGQHDHNSTKSSRPTETSSGQPSSSKLDRKLAVGMCLPKFRIESKFDLKDTLEKESSTEELCTALQSSEKILYQLRDELKDWLSLQPHLPQDVSEKRLEWFLLSTKFSFERAKQRLNMYYSLKQLTPEFFTNRDPCGPGITSIHNVIQFVVLPKLGPGNIRTVIFRVIEADSSKMSVLDIAKYIIMVGDIRMVDSHCYSENFVIDLAMVNPSQVMKCTPTLIKKGHMVGTKAYGARISGVHVINAPPFIHYTVTMIKSIISPKLSARVHFYQPGNLDKLYESIPKSILPKDYGGDELTMAELHAGLREKVETRRDWFIEQDKIKVNNHSGPTPAINEDSVFGISGSFRKIEID